MLVSHLLFEIAEEQCSNLLENWSEIEESGKESLRALVGCKFIGISHCEVPAKPPPEAEEDPK
jgi:hypothetical protein